MLEVLEYLYIYHLMNDQNHILNLFSKSAAARPFASRRRP